MRLESLFWSGMIVLAALGVRWESHDVLASADADLSRGVVVERFAARALELRNLSGDLEIESWSGTEVEVTLEGASDAVSLISRQLEGGSLVVNGGALTRRVADKFAGIGSVSVFTTGGGSSQIIIGRNGLGRARTAPRAPLVTRVRLPAGLPITIRGQRGDVVSDDLAGPLVLELLQGTAAFGRIRDARLSLAGKGKISVREARGDLSVALAGAGGVQVETSYLERLEVGLTGNGTVDVGGRARFASLSLVGSGRIYVAEAERQPLVTRVGSGEVVVGAR